MRQKRGKNTTVQAQDPIAQVHEGKKISSDMKFTVKKSLKLHIARYCKSKKSLECDLCDIKFTKRFHLKRHLAKHIL